jgi:hypothetical protein
MKITLCGSTRFAERFREANIALTMAGHIVYSISLAGRQAGQEADKPFGITINDDDKRTLDLVHLKKISESDAIIVIGWRRTLADLSVTDTSYIGESTRREIEWAVMSEKTVLSEDDIQGLVEEGPRSAVHNILVKIDEPSTL